MARHKNHSLALALALSLSIPAWSALGQSGQDPLIPLKTLLAPPTVLAPKISPDGKRISFLAPINGVMNIMVAPVGDLKAARPITQDAKRGIQAHTISGDPAYLWAPDGAHMLYLQDKNGDENWLLYSVNIETREVKNLTPFQNTQARVIGLNWNHPDQALIALNNRDPKWHDVYRVNFVTGKLELVEKNDRFYAYVADNDPKLRVAVALGKNGSLISR